MLRIFPFSIQETLEFFGDKKALRRESLVALSGAFLAIPQAIALSVVVGLPLHIGIWSTIFGTIIASLFGSSPYLLVGPSNSMCILLYAGITEVLYTHYHEFSGGDLQAFSLLITSQLVVLVGIIQLLGGLFSLGKMSHFVSRSLISAYLVGVMFSLCIAQCFPFFGLEVEANFSVFDKCIVLLTQIHQLHLPTAAVGLSTLGAMFFFKNKSRILPPALLSLTLAACLSWLLNIKEEAWNLSPMKMLGTFSLEMPKLSLPFFELQIMDTLLPMAFAIALLGLVEMSSLVKNFSAKSGKVPQVNQDVFALGVSNLCLSFLAVMPISASHSRTAWNYTHGAQTRFAGILCGLFSLMLLPFLSYAFTWIPLSALAALILYAAKDMVNISQLFMCMRSTKGDALVVWVTLLSCLFFRLDTAFFLGFVFSIAVHMNNTAHPEIVHFTYEEDDERITAAFREQIRVIHVKGDLFFGAADLFQTSLSAIGEEPHVRVLMLHLKNAYHLDASACIALRNLERHLRSSGRLFLLTGVRSSVAQVLEASGLIKEWGGNKVFTCTGRSARESVQEALVSASEFLEHVS